MYSRESHVLRYRGRTTISIGHCHRLAIHRESSTQHPARSILTNNGFTSCELQLGQRLIHWTYFDGSANCLNDPVEHIRPLSLEGTPLEQRLV